MLKFGSATVERESPVPELQPEHMLAHVIVKASKVYEDEPAIIAMALAIEASENHYEVFEATIEVSKHIKLPPPPMSNKGHEGKGYQAAGRQ